jgi:hypothetical protein
VGRLHGLDFDTVEAASTVRWVAGITTAGRLKAGYLNERIAFDYPYTRFEGTVQQIGASSRTDDRETGEIASLEGFLEGADLMIDATAELGIQQALAALAEEREIPALFVSATEGARGGIVARIDPAEGGCWMCLQRALEDGRIPLPPHAPAEDLTVQPRGCSDVTYLGTGFDLLPIIAQAARCAASSLREDSAGGSVAFICSLPGDPEEAPQWSRHSVERDPACPVCAGRGA